MRKKRLSGNAADAGTAPRAGTYGKRKDERQLSGRKRRYADRQERKFRSVQRGRRKLDVEGSLILCDWR